MSKLTQHMRRDFQMMSLRTQIMLVYNCLSRIIIVTLKLCVCILVLIMVVLIVGNVLQRRAYEENNGSRFFEVQAG